MDKYNIYISITPIGTCVNESNYIVITYNMEPILILIKS